MLRLQKARSRRQFLCTVGMAAGVAVTLRAGWAAETIDPRVADIVAMTIGIDTHNHIDVPLSDAEMPGLDIDLKGEMKRRVYQLFARPLRLTINPAMRISVFSKG